MPLKYVIFFPDPVHNYSRALKLQLSKLFRCFESKSLDEYLQVYEKSGRFVLVFSEPKVAIDFIKTNRKELVKLEYVSYLMPNKDQVYSENLSEVLDGYKITLITAQLYPFIDSDIKKYFERR